MNSNDFYKIGKIGRPHGINGEVLLMFSDDVFDTTDADHLMLMVDSLLVPFFMEEYRFKSDETAIVKFEGVETKEQAQRLTNCEVFFPRQAAEEADHYSLNQLLGYEVLTATETTSAGNAAMPAETSAKSAETSAKYIGKIQHIDTSTENYLFEVQTPDNDELLIPVVDDWVISLNHANRQIILRLPEGLLD